MKRWSGLAVVFVVSWATGMSYVMAPCMDSANKPVTLQPGLVCAKANVQRSEQAFKSQEAADAFAAVMKQMKATDVQQSTRARLKP